MKSSNRDILVLSKKVSHDPQELEHELEMLHELLYRVETIENFCTASEILDVNRYRIIQKANTIAHLVRENKLRPFQFLSNKN